MQAHNEMKQDKYEVDKCFNSQVLCSKIVSMAKRQNIDCHESAGKR